MEKKIDPLCAPVCSGSLPSMVKKCGPTHDAAASSSIINLSSDSDCKESTKRLPLQVEKRRNRHRLRPPRPLRHPYHLIYISSDSDEEEAPPSPPLAKELIESEVIESEVDMKGKKPVNLSVIPLIDGIDKAFAAISLTSEVKVAGVQPVQSTSPQSVLINPKSGFGKPVVPPTIMVEKFNEGSIVQPEITVEVSEEDVLAVGLVTAGDKTTKDVVGVAPMPISSIKDSSKCTASNLAATPPIVEEQNVKESPQAGLPIYHGYNTRSKAKKKST